MRAHSNTFAHVAKAIAEVGITVVSYDYRGYGKSQGAQGLIESLDCHL